MHTSPGILDSRATRPGQPGGAPRPARNGSGIGVLAAAARTVNPQATTADARRLLEGCSPLSSVVIAEGHHPVGLLMNYSLARALSSRFGREVFLKRSVTHVMDASPLTVDAAEPVETVTNRALARDDTRRYDDIVVTRDGRLVGTVAVQDILGALARAEAVRELAGAAAHELNQPLQVIMGYCELMSRAPVHDLRRPDWHAIMRDQVRRMATITRKLQDAVTYETRPYLHDSRILDLDRVDGTGAPLQGPTTGNDGPAAGS